MFSELLRRNSTIQLSILTDTKRDFKNLGKKTIELRYCLHNILWLLKIYSLLRFSRHSQSEKITFLKEYGVYLGNLVWLLLSVCFFQLRLSFCSASGSNCNVLRVSRYPVGFSEVNMIFFIFNFERIQNIYWAVEKLSSGSLQLDASNFTVFLNFGTFEPS